MGYAVYHVQCIVVVAMIIADTCNMVFARSFLTGRQKHRCEAAVMFMMYTDTVSESVKLSLCVVSLVYCFSHESDVHDWLDYYYFFFPQ